MMVTGASGFVGRALVSALVEDGICVSCPARPRAQVLLNGVDFHEIDGIDALTDWGESLRSC